MSEQAESDYLAEAMQIYEGETMLLPERQHIIALVRENLELRAALGLLRQEISYLTANN